MSNDQQHEEYTILTSTGSNSRGQMSQPHLTFTPPTQVFRSEWQRFPEFHAWLRPIEGDVTKAWCVACERIFRADLKSLRVHGVSKAHVRMVRARCPNADDNPVPPIEYNVVTDKKGTYGIAVVTNKEDKSSLASRALYMNQTNPTEEIITSEMAAQSQRDKYVVVSLPNEDEDDSEGPQATSSNTQYIQKEVNVIDETGNLVSVVTEHHIHKNKDNDDEYEVGLQSNDYHSTSNYEKMDQKHEEIQCKAIVSKSAPFWKATAVVNGHVTELKLSDYSGRYLVLFFYPQDFSRICPSELIALSDRVSEFRALNTEVVACSVDSYLSHQAWSRTLRSDGGIAIPKMPLLSDPTHAISKSYGCYLPELGHSLRAHYIIDMRGILRHVTINDLPVGRNIGEILRLLEAFQYTDETETLCPADWKPGEPTIS